MDISSYLLSRKFTKDSIIGLGAVKGAPCTIKSTEHRDGVTYVTFEWTTEDGSTKRQATINIIDGASVRVWESGTHYKFGDIVLYESAFYKCTSANSDAEFDENNWEDVASFSGDYGVVDRSNLLPEFTANDRKVYYSIEDKTFYLWNGERWVAQIVGIDNAEDYSTDEKVIGSWTDGKTLFQKTINFGKLPANGDKSISYGVNNASIKKIFGYATNGTDTINIPHPATSLSEVVSVTTNASAKLLTATTGMDRSNYSAYITIQYTK